MKSPSLSFWEKSVWIGQPDLVIVGSGIVGINAALSYREKYPTAHILVLERGVFSTGASTRNAGFACFGSVSEILSDLKSHTEQEVMNLIRKRWEGLERLKSLVGAKRMDFEATGSYEYFESSEEELFNTCIAQKEYVNQLVEEAIGISNVFRLADEKVVKTGMKVQHLIENIAEGMLNTGKMMKGLLDLAYEKNIQFFNGVKVDAIEECLEGISLSLDNGWEIKATKCIVATNGFTASLLPDLDLQPARNLVLITKPIPNMPFNACFHGEEGFYYFRSVGNRVLLGGGRNLAIEEETTDQFGVNPKIKAALLNKLKTLILPNYEVEVEQWWSGILGVGKQKYPIVRKMNERLVVVARLGGMGVAIGSLLGQEAVERLDS